VKIQRTYKASGKKIKRIITDAEVYGFLRKFQEMDEAISNMVILYHNGRLDTGTIIYEEVKK